MKRRNIVIFTAAVAALMLSGCGAKSQPDATVTTTTTTTDTAAANTTETAVAPAQVVASPTPTPTVAPSQVVQMTSNVTPVPEDNIKNVIGNKTADASRVAMTNNTAGTISEIYIRVTPSSSDEADDDSTWGSDLISGSFTLPAQDKCAYYYASGGNSQMYDIRITFTDDQADEFFFRSLPLTTIKELSFCQEGVDEDAIPYVIFTTNDNKKYSTLNSVKQRLGISSDTSSDTSESSDTTEDYNTDTSNTDSTDTENTSQTTEDTGEDNNSSSSSDDNGGNSQESSVDYGNGNAALDYVGGSLEDYIGNAGSPNDYTYENDDANGETGYYYYDGYTISTTFDENGNEIISGVW